jgi:hypothetical protein
MESAGDLHRYGGGDQGALTNAVRRALAQEPNTTYRELAQLVLRDGRPDRDDALFSASGADVCRDKLRMIGNVKRVPVLAIVF